VESETTKKIAEPEKLMSKDKIKKKKIWVYYQT